MTQEETITLGQFLLEKPLYKKYKLEDIILNSNIGIFSQIEEKYHRTNWSIWWNQSNPAYVIKEKQIDFIKTPYKDTLDSFCVNCKKSSTFEYNKRYVLIEEENKNNYSYESFLHPNTFFHNYYCTRCNENEIIFLIQIQDESISKIAQFPTELSLMSKDLSKYLKKWILSEEKVDELKKSIISYSNNYAIPAYLYLRWVFEYLINTIFEETKIEYWITEDIFKDKKMVNKILLLKSHLPDFLNENKHIYSILSKWVHELSEEECINYYEILKESLILILDERIEIIEKKNKKSSLHKLLWDFSSPKK